MITILGIAAGSVSGVMEARRKNMDIVGACVVAFVTALGGGTLRDMLLGNLPVFWIKEQQYALMALGFAVLVFYSSRLLMLSHRSILIPDALGLGFFSVLGATIALQLHATLFVASLMGVVTGVFGGILRDVLCNEIPNVFARNTTLYATCSFVGAWVYLLATSLGIGQEGASLAGMLVAIGLRLFAVRYDLRLPEPYDVFD
jgi:uncharacterized membrane protein YeiH